MQFNSHVYAYVCSPGMYIKDDSNVDSDVFFCSFDISPRGHYEMFGEGTGDTEALSGFHTVNLPE